MLEALNLLVNGFSLLLLAVFELFVGPWSMIPRSLPSFASLHLVDGVLEKAYTVMLPICKVPPQVQTIALLALNLDHLALFLDVLLHFFSKKLFLTLWALELLFGAAHLKMLFQCWN